MRSAFFLMLLGSALWAGRTAWAGEPVQIQNPTLEAVGEELPAGWELSLGATNGDGPLSSWKVAEPGVFALVGDAATRRWRMLTQTVSVQEGKVYRFVFDVRSRGVRLDQPAGLHPNCWVGALFEDAKGERRSMEVLTVAREHFEQDELVARAPAGATQARLGMFLSLPGQLEMRQVRAERLSAGESYEVLLSHLERHYPFLAAHGIDLQALSEGSRAAAEAAPDAPAFVQAVTPLLAALRDLHVSIASPGEPPIATYAAPAGSNFDVSHLRQQITDLRQAARETITGHTAEGFGYIGIGGLMGSAQDLQQMDAALRGQLQAPALIIDLRPNQGGAESWAQQLVAHLCQDPVTYARAIYRAGRSKDAFYEVAPRVLRPDGSGGYRGPIAVLIGPGCVSSGEGFALALKALPGVALFGEPTRGASANPQPLDLPNGVRVNTSRWLTLTPDGTPLERHGVQPTHPVAATTDSDAPLLAARAWLREQRALREGR